MPHLLLFYAGEVECNSCITVELDTTPPQDVELIAPPTASESPVELQISVADLDTTGYQMKIWVGNEAASDWINFSETALFPLGGARGDKTISLRVRDDVWNESVVATDILDWQPAFVVDNIRVKVVVFIGNATVGVLDNAATVGASHRKGPRTQFLSQVL